MGPLEEKRFDVFFEKHIGFGLRWDTDGGWPLHLSISFPFVTIAIGIGRERDSQYNNSLYGDPNSVGSNSTRPRVGE